MESGKVTQTSIADVLRQASLPLPGLEPPAQLNTLTTHQVAEIIHYNISVVERMCREGRLPAWRVGAKWIILADEFYAMLKAGQAQPDFRRQTVMAKEGTKIGTASGKPVNLPKKEPPAKEAAPAKKPAPIEQRRSFGFHPVFVPDEEDEK